MSKFLSGRDLFYKYEKLMNKLYYIYSLFPSWIKSIFCFGEKTKISFLIRYFNLRYFSNSCGVNIYIGNNVVIKNKYNLSIGDNVSIHDFCYIDALGGILIGNNVSIAHQTSILSFNHTWDNSCLPIKYNPIEMKPVIINDDVWIGCGVRIMPGVTIGSRCVVAAGSIVTKNVPPGSLVAGTPAKVIKKI